MKLIGSLLGFSLLVAITGSARAEIRPDKIFVADEKKSGFYIRDGLIVGGDRAIDPIIVKDIRRAANRGFERVVIDLSTPPDETVGVPRPAYFQVAVSPDENRIIFTIWGHPELKFNSQKVLKTFKRSKAVKNVQLFPRVEDSSWTFAFDLKGKHPVEVFELSNPVRVIMDIK